MAMNDFGIGREKIIAKSNVRAIFTPHIPILTKDLFFGRSREVQKLIEQISTPGQHSLLYGDRGIGKSSLANVLAALIPLVIPGMKKVYLKRCDSTDTFVTILAEPLKDCGFDISIKDFQRKHKQGGKTEIAIPVIAKGGIASERENTESSDGINSLAQSPGWVADKLKNLKAFFVIDEADTIKRKEDRKKLAELIKHLSDSGSSFKLLVVGIADTAEHLTAGHPSVHRCLKETKLGRMTDDELREIINTGAKKLRIVFEYPVIRAIVEMSAGYPHFTHLLALKCAEEAIAESRASVTLKDLEVAMGVASEEVEGTLKKTFDDAVRSIQTEMYRRILCSAAYCGGYEFSASNLREKIKTIYDVDINQRGLNNYLKKLVSDDGTTILRRIAKGVYRFTDPRMPSYVKIATRKIIVQ